MDKLDEIILYGRTWNVLRVGAGPTLILIDYPFAMPIGTVLEDSRTEQHWLVKDGARDLSQPGKNFAWLERYNESVS